MLRIIFLGFLLSAGILSNARNFLVTKANDTIFIEGDLETNRQTPAKWTLVTANGVTYKISEIKCIEVGNDFYHNIHGRRMWKRVVQGKINVFALYDKDTLRNERGHLQGTVLIQKEAKGDFLEYNTKNLFRLVKDNDSLHDFTKKKLNAGRSGKALSAAGIAISGASFFTLLIEGFLAILSADVDNLEIYAIMSATGIAAGAGGIATGLIINKKSNHLNLDPVYYYNSH